MNVHRSTFIIDFKVGLLSVHKYKVFISEGERLQYESTIENAFSGDGCAR